MDDCDLFEGIDDEMPTYPNLEVVSQRIATERPPPPEQTTEYIVVAELRRMKTARLPILRGLKVLVRRIRGKFTRSSRTFETEYPSR